MKKRYGIEKKLINPMFTRRYNADLEYTGESKIKCWFNEWRLWRKYETARQRDEAFKALSSNRFIWEYRKINL